MRPTFLPDSEDELDASGDQKEDDEVVTEVLHDHVADGLGLALEGLVVSIKFARKLDLSIIKTTLLVGLELLDETFFATPFG